MELNLQNEHQVKIADLLWAAQDQSSVNLILRTFGHDARVVYDMMLAAVMDEVSDTNLAELALDKIFNKE